MLLQSLVLNAGAGTGAFAKVFPGSTDSRGTIAITTGSSPYVKASLFYLLFKEPHEPTAVCLLPMSDSAKRYFSPTDRHGFHVEGTFDPNTIYIWQYKVGKLCFDYLAGR